MRLLTVNYANMKKATAIPKFALLACMVAGLSACNWLDGDDADAPVANRAPVAESESLITQTDTNIMETLSAFDADGDALTFSISGEPMLGQVSLGSNGNYTYSPDLEVTGTDSFEFTVSDADAAVATGTITIRIETLQVSFSEISRDAFLQAPTDTPLSVNGRAFTQDVVNQTDYQDLIDNN
jgi:VCBS repeat-containing protein